MSIASESGAQRCDDTEKTSVVAGQNSSVFSLFLKVKRVSAERVFTCREFQTVRSRNRKDTRNPCHLCDHTIATERNDLTN